ncbi:methylmalonyl-CoA mutase family protein [Labrys miyagiensis]|nr:methylmalonyl-CoA mutase family protein [Labrys miyagiensis]
MSGMGEDEARWREAVAGVLKGASYEDTLTTLTPDGVRLEAVYPRRSGTAPIPGRRPATPWTIVQRVDHPQAVEANALALEDLEGGAGGLSLVTNHSPYARGFGVAIPFGGDLDRLLDKVQRDAVVLRLDAGAHTLDVARLLGEIPGGTVHYGYDPVGLLAATGALPPAWPSTVSVLASHRQNGTVVTADGRVFHEAGATSGLELACVLSAGLAYLRILEATGIRLEEARHCIGFTLAADQNVFATIAKFRALRLAWQQIEKACDLAPAPIHLHAETAWRMLSRRDPATNILRGGLATAAAGLGGADSITTLPYTSANGLPDGHARRIARNCQHVLLSEANLHRITDPAAGSGGLEAMTESLCEAAWMLLQGIEREHGIVKALQSGWVRAQIDRLRVPPDPIIGASKYVLAEEPAVSVLRPLVESTAQLPAPALPRRRDALDFEATP